jgi:hypothetical protein
MFAKRLAEHDDTPVDDKIVVLRDATWADFQRLLELKGESSVPRLAYLEGAIEITTPSRPHESLKSRVGQLVEVWCLENDIEFSAYGSWTLERKEKASGIEPDECYVFGVVREPERPDLAIEVVWTSGGVKRPAASCIASRAKRASSNVTSSSDFASASRASSATNAGARTFAIWCGASRAIGSWSRPTLPSSCPAT